MASEIAIATADLPESPLPTPSRQSSEEKPSFQAASQPQHRGSIHGPLVEELQVTECKVRKEEEEGKKDIDHADRNEQVSMAWKKRMQEELFHRTKEEETVLRCYESMLQGQEECSLFLLVTGPVGSGKTRLVKHTLEKRVRDQGGYFLTG